MPKKRVFISSRIKEMRAFREMAFDAIREAGMEPVFVDSTDPDNRWPLKMGIPVFHQLIEAVKSSDVFVGIYGNTLRTNWIPPGETRHIMEFEYEAARSKGLPCFCYVTQSEENSDDDMRRFRRQVMEIGVEFLTTPQALKEHLLSQLRHLNPRIFISYSSKDKDFVDKLHEKLKRSGQHVWLNTESIPKGEGWYEEMTAGLSETDVLVLIVSPDSMASKWVKEEWQTFLGSDKTILPVLHKDCDVPQEINRLQMIKTDKQDWYYELLKAIEARL